MSAILDSYQAIGNHLGALFALALAFRTNATEYGLTDARTASALVHFHQGVRDRVSPNDQAKFRQDIMATLDAFFPPIPGSEVERAMMAA